jgi:hypothetical protein
MNAKKPNPRKAEGAQSGMKEKLSRLPGMVSA